ncbi:hypothetical protein C3E98_000900 [Pseudomonas sp. MWU13-2625]|nr:hypothetical protein C3E98_000900 [Pseudomonas sp. MWU13-2625]
MSALTSSRASPLPQFGMRSPCGSGLAREEGVRVPEDSSQKCIPERAPFWCGAEMARLRAFLPGPPPCC